MNQTPTTKRKTYRPGIERASVTIGFRIKPSVRKALRAKGYPGSIHEQARRVLEEALSNQQVT